MRNKRLNNSGFTLIELIVVVVIMAVVTSTVLISLSSSTSLKYQSSMKSFQMRTDEARDIIVKGKYNYYFKVAKMSDGWYGFVETDTSGVTNPIYKSWKLFEDSNLELKLYSNGSIINRTEYYIAYKKDGSIDNIMYLLTEGNWGTVTYSNSCYFFIDGVDEKLDISFTTGKSEITTSPITHSSIDISLNDLSPLDEEIDFPVEYKSVDYQDIIDNEEIEYSDRDCETEVDSIRFWSNWADGLTTIKSGSNRTLGLISKNKGAYYNMRFDKTKTYKVHIKSSRNKPINIAYALIDKHGNVLYKVQSFLSDVTSERYSTVTIPPNVNVDDIVNIHFLAWVDDSITDVKNYCNLNNISFSLE